MTVTTLVASQFPSRAQCNPYIQLLKSSLAQSRVRTHEHDLFVDGVGLPYPTADPEWLRRHQGRVNLLHFHWLQKFYRAPSEAESQRRMAQFAHFLDLARRLDYRIAYTFHNLFPHEGMGAELDVAMRRLIIQHADVMTCFSQRQKARLRDAFGPIRLTVIPHANYTGCYRDDLSPAECRRRLDLPPEARVFAYIGLVRGYKELPYLIDTFADLDLPDAVLLLAGTAWGATFNVTTFDELKTAIDTAEANGENDTINISAGTYNVSSALNYLASSSPVENYSLTIQSSGGEVILDGAMSLQILSIQTLIGGEDTSDADITIKGITFQSGRISSEFLLCYLPLPVQGVHLFVLCL